MRKLIENLLFSMQKIKQHEEEIVINETGKKENSYIFFIAGKIEAYNLIISELEKVLILDCDIKSK